MRAILGAVLGVVFAVGVLSILAWQAARTYRLGRRIEPYLRGRVRRTVGRPAALGAAPVGSGVVGQAAWLAAFPLFSRWLERPDAALNRRLRRSGSALRPDEYRVQRLLWSSAGGGAMMLLALLVVTQREVPSAVGLAMIVCGVVAGRALRDYSLAREVRARADRIAAEFPAFAEFVALAVTAGEGPVQALERVAGLSHGALAEEVRVTVSDVRAGATLAEALDALAERTGSPAVARFADATAVAAERGTPLAGVLRAQAQDLRDADRRRLMELAGTKEIGMLVPVIFVVLPVTVVFAVFPGLVLLRLGVG